MESWALVYLVVAVITAIMAFGGFAGSATGIAKAMFVICLALSIVSAIRNRKPRV